MLFKYLMKQFMKPVYLCWGGDDEEGESAAAGLAATGTSVYEKGKMTPEEEKQYKSSFDLGEFILSLTKYYSGIGESPKGFDPDQTWVSTLEPSLKIAEDYANRAAQDRGLIRSGIPIESMGRAGVELAIKDAAGRLGHRQSNMANLANLYGQQQGYGLSAKQRQAGQAQAAGQYWAYPYQAQLGSYYGGKSAGQALPGQLMGALGTFGSGTDWSSLFGGGGSNYSAQNSINASDYQMPDYSF